MGKDGLKLEVGSRVIIKKDAIVQRDVLGKITSIIELGEEVNTIMILDGGEVTKVTFVNKKTKRVEIIKLKKGDEYS